VTNGTAAGTFELTGISGANASGVAPYQFAAVNGEALFNGIDTAGNFNLWMTNGTALGTQEITGITNAYSRGINPNHLTVFNGEWLFAGYDAAHNYGLWVTNGTAAGTQEIAVTGGNATLFSPYDLTVLTSRNEVLFNGYDSNNILGLWVTNGTAAGTYELTGISGAKTAGTGLDPTYLTVYNSELLFNGYDTANNLGLWVTDGTAAGTQELTGISGVNTGAGGLDPTEFTAFNGEMLFNGIDAAGNYGLWVTNGTAAGTYELTGITGAYSGPFGLNPTNLNVLPTWSGSFAAYNSGEVFFAGRDTSGAYGLWVTDGTGPGTHELTGISGVNSNGLAPVSLTVTPNPPPPAGTTADMILRDTSGNYQIYNIGGNVLSGTYSYYLGQVGPEWQVAGLGGFYDGDTTDMMLRDSNNGAFEIYDISNNNITGAFAISAPLPAKPTCCCATPVAPSSSTTSATTRSHRRPASALLDPSGRWPASAISAARPMKPT
jgi:ELWxxDGT repeat protein